MKLARQSSSRRLLICALSPSRCRRVETTVATISLMQSERVDGRLVYTKPLKKSNI
jgi:hypothetical protein